jgi:hypothetical protein
MTDGTGELDLVEVAAASYEVCELVTLGVALNGGMDVVESTSLSVSLSITSVGFW